MSAALVLKGNGIDPGRVTLLATQVTDNAYKALTTRRVAATLMAPPYAEELEAKGYRRLAEARTHAPLSFIGLGASTDSLKRDPTKAYGLIAALHRTLVTCTTRLIAMRLFNTLQAFTKSICRWRKRLLRRRCNPTARTAPNRALRSSARLTSTGRL